MQIAILGPLEVRDDTGAPADVAGIRLRTLLIRLAIAAGRPVGVAELVDAVWADEPPVEENNALQTLVSRLRRALGTPRAVVQSAAGYCLVIETADLDAHRFEAQAAAGAEALRDGDPREAVRLLHGALALWRGPALVDAVRTTDALGAYLSRLEQLRLVAILDLVEAQLQAGDTPVVAELEALAAEHPLHERLAGHLVRALAAAGRQSDALAVYERVRARLADELGVDPSQELRDVHLAVLRGELGAPNRRAYRRTNLKAQLTSFVGREAEVARIGKLLEQHRLVTLVGPGGAGKTRLASEAVARVVDTAPDGVWLIEFARVNASVDVPRAVLNSLGMREMRLLERPGNISARDANTLLTEGLADKKAVLVFDNCEHVIEASAHLADQLLAHCPELRVLATSREPLGIVGEVLLAVPPLGQPPITADAAEALDYPAVRLFADRAGAAQPDFCIDDLSVRTVIEILRRLDGLPLAIELAAARLRTLPLSEIAARLSDRFRLLTGGGRTALPRHRTLRAVVEWSWGLLTPDERRLIEQLSVFSSGVTEESAAAISDVPAAQIPDLLASLIDKSLLQPVDDGRRVRMLETIREYGAERLAERGELGSVRARHAAHFAAVLAEAEPQLATAGQLPWFALLRAERENIVAAMRYLSDLGDADGALRMAVALGCYAMILGEHGEISAWMAEVLAVEGGQDSELRMVAKALHALNSAAIASSTADMTTWTGDLDVLAGELDGVSAGRSGFSSLLRPSVAFFAGAPELAARYLREALASEDEWSRAAARLLRANLAENDGDLAAMRADIDVALTEFRHLGERWGLAGTLSALGQLKTFDGELDAAIAAYVEAQQFSAELGSREDESFLLVRLADLELRRGELESARRYLASARSAAEDEGGPIESVFTQVMLAAIEFEAGNLDEARVLQREALRRMNEMPLEHPAQGHIRAILLVVSARIVVADGELEVAQLFVRQAFAAAVGTRDLPIIATVGVVAAQLVAGSGASAQAALMLGAAARLRGADDRTACEITRLTAALRTALGDEQFDTRYARGKALDREAALAALDPG